MKGKKVEKLMFDFDTQAQIRDITLKINEIIDAFNSHLESCGKEKK